MISAVRELLSRHRNSLFSGIAIFLFTSQLGQMTFYASRAAGTRADIVAIDEDGRSAIDVTNRTRWYSSNGFHPYGSFYFRLAHTFTSVFSPMSDGSDLSPDEQHTFRIHFALLFVSVLALCGIGLLLGSVIGRGHAAVLLTATIFVRVFLEADTWREFLLRAHPDMVLALVTAFAGVSTFKYWQDPSERRLKFMAWAWGLCMTTKFSTILFLPFVVCWLVLPADRFRRLSLFLGHSLLAFFVIGFPQNFSFQRIYNFLKALSAFSVPATLATMIDWFKIWGSQVVWPAAAAVGMIAIVAIMRAPRTTAGRLPWLPCLALGFGPFILMLAQNIILVHNHYVMPLVALQIALFLLVAGAYFNANIDLRPATLASPMILGLAAVGFMFFGVVPKSLSASLALSLRCRPEAREVFQQIMVLQKLGLKIYVDPYVPTMESMKHLGMSWRPDKAWIAAERFDVLIFSTTYNARYSENAISEYVERYNHNRSATTEFYALFRNQQVVRDTIIGTWKRETRDNCGWEIWRREN